MPHHYKIGDKVLGNFRLIRFIGEGSYGRVFEAKRIDGTVADNVAIKIISIPKDKNELMSIRTSDAKTYFRSVADKVLREVEMMLKLKGKTNIVSYEDHEIIEYDDNINRDIIIRMELLTPLLDYIKNKPLTRKEIIQLGIDICKALELCQKSDIIHRDIKPENIFVSNLDDFVLGDFGVARTVTNATMATKAGATLYMAPEVFKEEKYSSAADIYSLGLVLYEFLNNGFPFLPENFTIDQEGEALKKRITGEKIPAPKNTESPLAEIVLKACAYEPQERYTNPTEMRQELEKVIHRTNTLPVLPPRPGGHPEPGPNPPPQPGDDDPKLNPLPQPGDDGLEPPPPNPTRKKWFVLGVSTVAALIILIPLIVLFITGNLSLTHTITVIADTGGTVTGGGTVARNTTVALTATPNNEWAFVGWYDGETRINAYTTWSFVVTQTRTIQARFTQIHNIAVTAGTGGTVAGGGVVTHNTTVALTAIPNYGWLFDGWYEAETKVSSDEIWNFVVIQDRTFQARFKQMFVITVATGTGGTVTGGGAVAPNTTVALTAITDEGWLFDGWYEGGARVFSYATWNFDATQNRTLEARFMQIHTITATAGIGGTVTGGGVVTNNTMLTLTATPDNDWVFVGWYEEDAMINTYATWSFSATQSKSVRAQFAIARTITVTTNTGGYVTGGGIVAIDADITLTANPNNGWVFEGWYENRVRITSSESLNITASYDRTIHAQFRRLFVTISVSTPTDNGTVSGGGRLYQYTTVTLIATPNRGYIFDGWYEDTTRVYTNPEWRFAATQNMSLQARFSRHRHTITHTTGIYRNRNDASPADFVGPQVVDVLEAAGDWLLINTWLGEMWLNTNRIFVNRRVYAFVSLSDTTTPDFILNPQLVNVIRRQGNWFLINTDRGNRWIYLN